MKRIVCDTNVLLSGLIWKGPPHRLLAEVAKGRFVMFISRDLLEEVARTLEYPKLQTALRTAGLTGNQMLRWIVRHSTLVWCKPLKDPAVRANPSDDNVLACAVAAAADGIISGDNHLLALGAFEGIPIVSPAGFLEQTKR